MDALRITLLQADLRWERADSNRAHFDELLAAINEPTDLVALPEMFTTGFSMNPAPLAEPTEGPTLAWMRQWAQRLDAVLAGSIIAQDTGCFYNRLLWVRPDGSYRHYDKRHRFSLAGEDEHYGAGTQRWVEEWRGWRIMPLICYDLRFPVWSRNDLDYDALLYVANWPDKRSHAWRGLLTARAIENQAYVVGLNRVGTDGNGIFYAGGSCLLDFAGEYQAHLAAHEQLQTVVLRREALTAFRSRYRFLADRDDFLIHAPPLY